MLTWIPVGIGCLFGDGVITMFPQAPGWAAWLCVLTGAAAGWYYGKTVFGELLPALPG